MNIYVSLVNQESMGCKSIEIRYKIVHKAGKSKYVF